MNDNQFRSLVVDVGKILLNHIEHLGKYDDLPITYSDVANKLPYEFNPRNLDQPLGTLSEYCKESGLPLISTIVVNKDTYMPGAGFFRWFFPGSKEAQWPEIFVEQYNRVKTCHEWSPLAEKLGLE